VGRFAPLKHAYKAVISGLARRRVTHISKLEFLSALNDVFERVFTVANIQSSFRGAGLVPADPDVILSKLDVHPQTPPLPVANSPIWECKTPSNVKEIESQSNLVQESIRKHQNSSPTHINISVGRLAKSVKVIVHTTVLREMELRDLQRENEELSKRKSRKRKYLGDHSTLTVGEAQALVPPESPGGQEEGRSSSKRHRAGGAQRKCGNCGQPGHNRTTCSVFVLSETDSSESE
jgi:hypothetical protein